ncbi:MAG: TIR domain-containing protein [Saprospiraceae bacterium]
MTLVEIKKQLKSLVVKDLEKSLDKFESILNSEASFYNGIIIQQSSFNGLKREKNQGTISHENANMREARIRNAILSMIDDLEEEAVDMAAVVSALAKQEEKRAVDIPKQNLKNSGIYVSYAWKGKTEDTADLEAVVDKLDESLKTRGITIIRDKRDLGYKGKIKEFMEGIGRGDKIIVVISDKYLKSKNCMFELIQIYENKDFEERIFPIILSDADIYDPLTLLDYIDYWDDKVKVLNDKLRKIASNANMIGIQTELNNYVNIRASFDKLVAVLQDMNALTPEMHQNQNFEDLYQQLKST